MAKQTINIGTVANDGTGDPLRSAFDKANDNFTELYGAGALSIASDILTYTKADGTTSTVDLSPYLDEDARAIASGTLNSGTGIVTFTRDDASTFTLDLSALLDDTNLVTSVNTQTGAVVLDSDDIAEGSTNLYDKTVVLTGGTNVTVTGTYPSFTISSTDTNTQLSTEEVQDIVGAMVSGNTESNITVTYNDTTGKLEFTANAGDITSVTAGTGLSGGGTSGDVTINHAAHTGDVTGSTVLTIAADAVDGSNIADDSIDSEHYVDGSIDTAHFSLTAAINTVTDQNSGTLKLWSGSQASYDALTPDANTIYFIV